jgi:hypothetical protein
VATVEAITTATREDINSATPIIKTTEVAIAEAEAEEVEMEIETTLREITARMLNSNNFKLFFLFL